MKFLGFLPDCILVMNSKLSLYCGLTSNTESKRKTVKFEIEELEKLQSNITNKLKLLEKNN